MVTFVEAGWGVLKGSSGKNRTLETVLQRKIKKGLIFLNVFKRVPDRCGPVSSCVVVKQGTDVTNSFVRLHEKKVLRQASYKQ